MLCTEYTTMMNAQRTSIQLASQYQEKKGYAQLQTSSFAGTASNGALLMQHIF
jgi:hypothetical protein